MFPFAETIKNYIIWKPYLKGKETEIPSLIVRTQRFHS